MPEIENTETSQGQETSLLLEDLIDLEFEAFCTRKAISISVRLENSATSKTRRVHGRDHHRG